MDYEKKYKEAIERLKQWDKEHPLGYSIQERDEFIFPELKESEDERIKKKIIATIHLYYGEPLEEEAKEMIAWLEKQGKQKPVNIDYISGVRKELLGIEDNAKNINGLTESQWVAIRAAHRLLGECITKEQKLAEWSDEDEKMYNVVHDLAWESYKTSRRLDIPTFGIINNWLKSLRPQSTWKPSDEQMEALKLSCGGNYVNLGILESLYNDLKKLKG